MKYKDFKSQYDLSPTIDTKSEIFDSKEEIIKILKETKAKKIIIECYIGVDYKELLNELIYPLKKSIVIKMDDYSLSINEINKMFEPYLTKDRVFGKMSNFTVNNLYDDETLSKLQKDFDALDNVILYGFGASLIQNYDLLLYVDISRWEIQLRYRNENLPNWNMNNYNDEKLKKYKRGYFIEWRIADRIKKDIFEHIDFYIDGNCASKLNMMTGDGARNSILEASLRPFRLKPYFDPGVWGGQWMKEVCNLDQSKKNYAWCFDGVPEENSVIFKNKESICEMPAINIVLLQAKNLLGDYVYNMFGAEFPIRFDLLDTMGGENLSLQVHPLASYIKKEFNMDYTQDESYYILDASDDASVYLGVKDSAKASDLIQALKDAQITNHFDESTYINEYKVKKHDHISIPSGTIHGSGSNTMVLEISATPYIFTFKLWDWGRLDFDGLPRPIHIEHGEQNIQFKRDSKWVENNLLNNVVLLEETPHLKIERTGLHQLEAIETIRHWHDNLVKHDNLNRVNMLNLVEGEEAIVESPTNQFQPFLVHYAETFIIPASVGTYTIRPFGPSIGKTIATIKAYIR